MTIVTRFAPSPTGYLHIGGARTALYAWLHARKYEGRFILRIEDTDRERSTPESVQAILEGMSWLGLDYDEGPYYQTERMGRYADVIAELLATGHAYCCTCSRERLDGLREQQRAAGLKPRYDGHCRKLGISSDTSEPHVIRFRTPEEGAVSFDDLVRGNITVANQELDDLVIARTDGSPTYNLTVVVDDLDMGITQVIRGDDHINNTPRQIHIMKALGATPPEFAHVPMILGKDGQRLSKRHGAVSVMQYRAEGFLPDAMLNYLVRLGWSYGDQEIFTRGEMTELFDLREVHYAPAAFDPDKLRWLNQQHLIGLDPTRLERELRVRLDEAGVDAAAGPDVAETGYALRERAKTLLELVELCRPFYEDFDEYEAKAAKKHLKADALPVLQALHAGFTALQEWQEEPLHEVIAGVAEGMSIGFGKVGPPLRVALLGAAQGPDLPLVLRLLGRERVLERITRAQKHIEG